jgi:MFS family permease
MHVARGLIIGLVSGFFVFGARAAFSVLYPAIVHETGWSVGAVSGSFAASLLVYCVVAVVAGFMVDAVGVKVVMAAGFAVAGVGLAASALVSSVWQMYMTWGLAVGVGLAATGFVPLLKALMILMPSRLGAGLGVAQLGQGLGAAVVTPLLQLCIDRLGWRRSELVVAGAILFVLVPLVVLAAPGRQSDHAIPAHPRVSGGVIANRSLTLLMVANFGVAFWLLVPTHQVAQLEQHSMSAIQAATTAGAVGVAAIIVGVVGGPITDRSLVGTLALGCACMVIGSVALALYEPSLPYLLPVFVIGSGVGRLANLANGVIVGRLLPVRTMGRLSGLLEVGWGMGAFAGPWLGALSFDVSGTYRWGMFLAAFAVILGGLSGFTAYRQRQPSRAQGGA